MAQLERLILIHSHLSGIIELDLQQHSNFCGTNASGKTTLQRLIPVFYGEQPNRVVPKTRKKFHEFYLPNSNSYLVYQYQNANGDACLSILSRNRDLGGVDYYLAQTPYFPSLFLTDDAEPRVRQVQELANHLRQQGIGISTKISATSEYRAVILNDAQASRSKDGLQLRKMAHSFGLVKGQQRLRHMEKLVSAVHAKEGKMDTLKTMLAAIFAEEGVELPSTQIRRTRVIDWVQQMRQSQELQELKKQLQQLQQLQQQLDNSHHQLHALHPLLSQDQQQSQQQLANLAQRLASTQQAQQQQLLVFQEQQGTQQSHISGLNADLTTILQQLTRIEERHQAYSEQDMPGLAQKVEQLPQQQQRLQEVSEQYQFLAGQHADLERNFNQQRLALREDFDRFRQQWQQQEQQERRALDGFYNEQNQALSDLDRQFHQHSQTLKNSFDQPLQGLRQERDILKGRLGANPLSNDEQEQLSLANLRVEQGLQDLQTQQQQLREQEQRLQQQHDRCQQSEQHWQQQRLLEKQLQEQQEQLQQGLQPHPDSLLAFLHQQLPDWQQSIGKVIDPLLLARTDLAPRVQGSDQQLYGLALALEAIATPGHALAREHMELQLSQLQQQLGQQQTQRQQAEQHWREQQQQLAEQQHSCQQAIAKMKQADDHLQQVRTSRERLDQELRQLKHDRLREQQAQLQRVEDELEQLRQQETQALQALQQQQQQQRLQFKADWQERLDGQQERLTQQQQQLLSREQQLQERLDELQQAFNNELSSQGLDPALLKRLQQQQQQLKDHIYQVQSRRQELTQYQEFMAVDWQQRKPQLQQQEMHSQSELRLAQQQLQHLQQQHQKAQQRLQQQLLDGQEQQKQQLAVLKELESISKQLQQLPLYSQMGAPLVELDFGDSVERRQRALHTLEQYQLLRKDCQQGVMKFEQQLQRHANGDFINSYQHEVARLPDGSHEVDRLPLLHSLLRLLQDQQQELLNQGQNIGSDLQKFFTVFRDLKRRIHDQSDRLSKAVSDDLQLEGIDRSEVRIESTIDDLGFWQPLSQFAKLFQQWRDQGPDSMPSKEYLDNLADLAEVLRADEQYNFESLMRLELHLCEGGNELIIRNDRQLLESSSHGMAYLILCKFLLAFTRLLRGDAEVRIHWPIDEIGTLAYHNVHKLFMACDANNIAIVGAFPNPESDVLSLFHHRYLIEQNQLPPFERQVKRIDPSPSKLNLWLQQQGVSA